MKITDKNRRELKRTEERERENIIKCDDEKMKRRIKLKAVSLARISEILGMEDC